MTETMVCRRPDADRIWTAPNAALGHRRLAVIDLPGGVQPMTVSYRNLAERQSNPYLYVIAVSDHSR